MTIDLRFVSSLDKVFMQADPAKFIPVGTPEGFQNETISFQAAYRLTEGWNAYLRMEIDSPIAEHVSVRRVCQVPVHLVSFEGSDDYWLSKDPGLYPDLLEPVGEYNLRAFTNRWESLWFDVTCDKPGNYPITIRLYDKNSGELAGAGTMHVRVLAGELPESKLIQTRWFYCDCLANYYNVPVFSEEHWAIIEKFMRHAVKQGINMILTPIHTPPLDTREGGERLTNQLVGIEVVDGEYRFDMTLLHRWIAMAKRCGVKYYEIAHLFTQWGAKHAPKIVAKVDGVEKKIFGWETNAAGEEYGKFLKAYVPAVRAVLKEEGVDDVAYWHISDEPHADHLPFYLAAKAQVADLLADRPIMDALSDFEFYQKKVVGLPIPATNHIEPFLDAKIPGLWTYYCCGQHVKVSNHFIGMPSARNRIIGVQMFKYDIKGFLQWGYNFYNSQYSNYTLDPFAHTDGDGFSQGGDPFLVYPGADGAPMDSIRLMIFKDALDDMCAMEKLAELIGRDKVIEMIDEGLEQPITFSEYPHDNAYLPNLRKRINAAIVRASAQ